jgi:phosphohistidine swiveling domain-containing protein
MGMVNENKFTDDSPAEASNLDSTLKALLYKLQNHPENTEDIKSDCDHIKNYLLNYTKQFDVEKIKLLSKQLNSVPKDVRNDLFILLKELLTKISDSWIVIKEILLGKNEENAQLGLDLLLHIVKNRFIAVNDKVINFFADQLSTENCNLCTADALRKISEIITSEEINSSDEERLLNIYFDNQNRKSQFLAAKLLDFDGNPIGERIIEKVLGTEVTKKLLPYLTYSRASYTDLLYLVTIVEKPQELADSLLKCEAVCGDYILKEVIVKLGWKKINYGLSVKHFVGITISNSLPLFVSDCEAEIFEKAVDAKRVSEFFLFTAHGGLLSEEITPEDGDKPVNLFRSYNLAHANLLQEILDVAPLTVKKVKNILVQMDEIVNAFVKLFSSHSDECTILPDVYHQLKSKVIKDLPDEDDDTHLSAEVTRLAQMFEDPKSLGEVHTIHGLKRYLHQRGLQLGFKLVDQSRSPNQSISLVLATSNRILSVIQNINFADFEPRDDNKYSFSEIPFPIKVVLEGFKRQLLNGLERFPSVNIFCYGNEVHYFVWFRNHPVFIRIDYSPPLQGGMIDLQYFGVSNYEIADHPNIYLDAIRYLFQSLEFDVTLECTHIHARYDKERALDLSQICDRAKYLFCLVPYTMDLDWIIGSLDLLSDAKKKVAAGWAKLFRQWGVLPFDKLITSDRLGILQDILITPQGEYELKWSGDGDYKDRFTIKVEIDFYKKLYETVSQLGLEIPKFSEENINLPGQLYWEDNLLNFLREAVNDSELIETTTGYDRTPKELFQRIHEAIWFAKIINEKSDHLKFSVALAKLIIPLEQTLKFLTTGKLENFAVQKAILPLIGSSLKLYVLRDNKGIIRLAFFSKGSSLYQKRKTEDESWQVNAEHSPIKLMSLLRNNNYTVIGSGPNIEMLAEDVQKFLDEIKITRSKVDEIQISGVKKVTGLRASPGRATGRVILGSKGRLPEDFNDHIFVAPSVSPDENTILYHSAGIVATGGGILSHAGLIATQFNKPAIIISGKWIQKSDGTLVLLFQTSEFKVERRIENNLHLSLYYDLHNVDHQLLNGDLVILDANEGTLEVLGQESDTIALYEEFKSLGKTNEEILNDKIDQELLALRGKKLHTRHQIEKLIKRITRPVILKFAISEILSGKFLEGNKSTADEKSQLINLILQNEKYSKLSESYLLQVLNEIENKFQSVCSEAEQIIPVAKYPFEVVMPRLETIRVYEMMKSVIDAVGEILSRQIELPENDINRINEISISSLTKLYENIYQKIIELSKCVEKKEYLRHLLRQITRVDLLLVSTSNHQIKIKEYKEKFQSDDKIKCDSLSGKFIINSGEGSLELSSLIGWKGANLAELEMIGGKGLVPPWFAVTDTAFQTVLDSVVEENIKVHDEVIFKGMSLRATIEKILSLTNISNREKSLYIRNLWDTISLPEIIRNEVVKSYREIEKEFQSTKSNKDKTSELYVAIRSSSCEEDAEIAARAGEFETYLFINGEESLIRYLKRTWSGLWTERAIHNRTIFGTQLGSTKGGVVVQRIVWSRVSGVLQTINVPKKDLREIVINAGLGLGEGVVSGVVAADQIIVSKEGNLQKGPLKFNYITSDKKEQIVFNRKAGYGTVLSPTLYHQRFRAALEYVELCELVAVASRLEEAYGYPLDIEFGIEGTKLWILQVRPVATFLPAFKETIEKYPLVNKQSEITQEELR